MNMKSKLLHFIIYSRMYEQLSYLFFFEKYEACNFKKKWITVNITGFFFVKTFYNKLQASLRNSIK